MRVFGTVVATILVIVFGVVAWGITMHVYWKWFMTPIFSISLTLGQAIGFKAFLSLALLNARDLKSDEDTTLEHQILKGLAFNVLGPIVFLLFGFVIYICI